MPSWRAQGQLYILRNLLLHYCSVYVIACNSRTQLIIEQFCGLRPEVCYTISSHANFAEETFASKLLDLLPVCLGLLLIGGGIVSMQATCEISMNERN
jgi:glutamate racemase